MFRAEFAEVGGRWWWNLAENAPRSVHAPDLRCCQRTGCRQASVPRRWDVQDSRGTWSAQVSRASPGGGHHAPYQSPSRAHRYRTRTSHTILVRCGWTRLPLAHLRRRISLCAASRRTRADCVDLSDAQRKWPCSDANGTAFWRALVAEEDPDVFVFTGDAICGGDGAGGSHAIDGLLADWADGGANAHVPWVAVEGALSSRAALCLYVGFRAPTRAQGAGYRCRGAPLFHRALRAPPACGAQETTTAKRTL